MMNIKTGKDLFNYIIGELKADEQKREVSYKDSIETCFRNISYEEFSTSIASYDPSLRKVIIKNNIKSIVELLNREDITLDVVLALCGNRGWRFTFDKYARPKKVDFGKISLTTQLRYKYDKYLSKKLCREVMGLSIKAGKDTTKPTSEIEARVFAADGNVLLRDFCDYTVDNGLELKIVKPYISPQEKLWMKYKQGKLVSKFDKLLNAR